MVRITNMMVILLTVFMQESRQGDRSPPLVVGDYLNLEPSNKSSPCHKTLVTNILKIL